MYYNFDQDQANVYFEKTCQVDQDNEACVLAKAMLGSSTGKLKKSESLTAKVLQIKEFMARGYFDQAQYKISELTKTSKAFESFSQVEQTKNLISLGKTDEAKGAYANTWSHMTSQTRQNFSSWYCLEEVDQKCESRNYLGCENLKSDLQKNSYEDLNAEAVIAMVSESECKKSNDSNMLAFHYVLEADESLQKLIYAISTESSWTQEARIKALREIAFQEDGETSRFIKRRAMITLLEKSRLKSDFEKVADYVERSKAHDWVWQKIAGTLLKSSFRAGYLHVAQRAANFVPDHYAKNHQIENMKKVALLKKPNNLNNTNDQDQIRIPASNENEESK